MSFGHAPEHRYWTSRTPDCGHEDPHYHSLGCNDCSRIVEREDLNEACAKALGQFQASLKAAGLPDKDITYVIDGLSDGLADVGVSFPRTEQEAA